MFSLVTIKNDFVLRSDDYNVSLVEAPRTHILRIDEEMDTTTMHFANF